MSVPALRQRQQVLLSLAALGSLAACGGSSHTPSQPAAKALPPRGSAAQDVSYRCVHGRQATISVSLPDPRKLAEVLNPINVCEYDGGLAEIAITVACEPGGTAKRVRVVAVNGQLPTSTSRTVCGT